MSASPVDLDALAAACAAATEARRSAAVIAAGAERCAGRLAVLDEEFAAAQLLGAVAIPPLNLLVISFLGWCVSASGHFADMPTGRDDVRFEAHIQQGECNAGGSNWSSTPARLQRG